MGEVRKSLHADGTVTLELVGLRTESEANTRGHWSKKANRTSDQRGTVAAIVRTQLAPRPSFPLEVTLTRRAPSEGLDDDNVRAAFKATRDGITDALGLPDDRDPRVSWRYRQTRGPWGVLLSFRAWDVSRPGARVLEGPEGTSVELVLALTDLARLAGALAEVREGRGAGLALELQGVRLLVRVPALAGEEAPR